MIPSAAAFVAKITKTTLDAILLTQQSVDALASRPPMLIDRGFHVLKENQPPCASSASAKRRIREST
jgi:hypothetical protein